MSPAGQRTLLYVMGAPGAGKSTLMRELTAPWEQHLRAEHPVPHRLLMHPATGRIHGGELGLPRADFPGTDALAMNIGPRAAQFAAGYPHDFLLGEGARLATRPFFTAVHQAGYLVRVACLEADSAVLDARCAQRGSTQDPVWRKGANTRASNIAQWCAQLPGAVVWRLDAQQPVERMVALLVDALPVLAPARPALPAQARGGL